MNHWLVKSEPGTYSWDNLVADKRTDWTGVRNFQASSNMKAMKKGDRAFFYHSGDEQAVVGTAEIAKEYYPDHTDETGKFGMVDVQAGRAREDAGHAGRHQGRAEAEAPAAGQAVAAVGGADRRAVLEADLRHGRHQAMRQG